MLWRLIGGFDFIVGGYVALDPSDPVWRDLVCAFISGLGFVLMVQGGPK